MVVTLRCAGCGLWIGEVDDLIDRDFWWECDGQWVYVIQEVEIETEDPTPDERSLRL